MVSKQRKKPKMNWLDTAGKLVTIAQGLASIGFIIYQIIKG